MYVDPHLRQFHSYQSGILHVIGGALRCFVDLVHPGAGDVGIRYFKKTIRRLPAAEFHIIIYHLNIKYVFYTYVTGCISSFRLFYCIF